MYACPTFLHSPSSSGQVSAQTVTSVYGLDSARSSSGLGSSVPSLDDPSMAHIDGHLAAMHNGLNSQDAKKIQHFFGLVNARAFEEGAKHEEAVVRISRRLFTEVEARFVAANAPPTSSDDETEKEMEQGEARASAKSGSSEAGSNGGGRDDHGHGMADGAGGMTDVSDLARVLLGLLQAVGVMRRAQGRMHRAVKAHKMQMRVAKWTGDVGARCEAFMDLAAAFVSLGRHEAALGLLNQALKLTARLPRGSLGKMEANIYLEMSRCYSASGKMQQALTCLRQRHAGPEGGALCNAGQGRWSGWVGEDCDADVSGRIDSLRGRGYQVEKQRDKAEVVAEMAALTAREDVSLVRVSKEIARQQELERELELFREEERLLTEMEDEDGLAVVEAKLRLKTKQAQYYPVLSQSRGQPVDTAILWRDFLAQRPKPPAAWVEDQARAQRQSVANQRKGFVRSKRYVAGGGCQRSAPAASGDDSEEEKEEEEEVSGAREASVKFKSAGALTPTQRWASVKTENVEMAGSTQRTSTRPGPDGQIGEVEPVGGRAGGRGSGFCDGGARVADVGKFDDEVKAALASSVAAGRSTVRIGASVMTHKAVQRASETMWSVPGLAVSLTPDGEWVGSGGRIVETPRGSSQQDKFGAQEARGEKMVVTVKMNANSVAYNNAFDLADAALRDKAQGDKRWVPREVKRLCTACGDATSTDGSFAGRCPDCLGWKPFLNVTNASGASLHIT